MRLRWIRVWPFTMGLLVAGCPAYALPKFAREYNVGCEQCHSIPPRLNPFGQAFQANNFNWPGPKAPPAHMTGLHAYPLSAIAEFSFEDNRTEGERSTKFRELELFLADGLRTGRLRGGGFFTSILGATTEKGAKEGNLEQAFLVLPVAGRRGQWTVGVGQFSPIMYQWDPVNKLTDASPAALADDFDEFSFAEPQPGIRVDYFDRRGEETADGRYLALGVPFEGHLAFNGDARLHGAHGVFAHAFQRRGPSSLGAFLFTHGGNTLGGLIATHALSKKLQVLGVGAIGDAAGHTQRLSIEGNYVAGPRLAVTLRLDALSGEEDDVGGAAAVTYYPFRLHLLRLTLETTQRKGDRVLALFARGQF